MALVPATTELSRPYWAGLARDELLVQQCPACHAIQHPPMPRCSACHGADLDWVALSGDARIYAYTVVTHAAHGQLADRVPYVVALVETTEGPRLVTDVVGLDDPWSVRIGMPVRLRGQAIGNDGIGLVHAHPCIAGQ